MRVHRFSRGSVALGCVFAMAAALPLAIAAQETTQPKSFEDWLRAGQVLRGEPGPEDVNWIENGTRYSYIVRDPQTGEETIRATDARTGRDTLLFSAQRMTFPGSSEPFSYDSFQWAKDSRHLVFQTHFKPIYRNSGTADYYVYTLADHSLQLAASGARTAELSPNGLMLGYERGGDMYVENLAQKRQTRLTSDATAHVYNGHFDWVYEEEFGLVQAWNWSPDSRYIAYWQVDESKEPIIQLSNYAGRHQVWDSIRIPQPGDTNPTVKIGVVNVSSGSKVWLDPGLTGDYYVPRIYWTSRADTLAMVTLDRRQQVMTLFFFDVRTGGKRMVMRDSSRTWIDVSDFYAAVQDFMTFPEGLTQFFWLSDRDGFQHIYRYDYSGKLIDQVTHGKWMVTQVRGIDPTQHVIYYSSTEASPLQRQLYAIDFDGTHERRLTTGDGVQEIDMSPNTEYYLRTYSSIADPGGVDVWTTAGKKLRTLVDNHALRQWLSTHTYARPQLFSVTTSDGVKLDASMVTPPAFDSTRKYPVIFAIYGGPGSQGVFDSFDGSPITQWLAQQGFIIVNVNNRGNNNYGSSFMKVVYGDLGKWESHDFAETAKYLAKKPYVDAHHIGIMGTSYGGYSTVFTMEAYPNLFTAGVANSPVTDWRLYDSIYTERYMGLLGENLAGYDSSSAVLHAGELGGHLLVIHSMMDDNVHPANTMQLLTAMTAAGKDVALRIYPPGRHGAAYDFESFSLIEKETARWLNHWLKTDSTSSSEASQ
ncbi:MAG TPA: S9 family peptidase [Gemmatimonadaceae bacterium]|nr:S9 family peptidase [Gemmatimonadaceae bacterium]